jgi:hypothetical protein
MADSNEGLRGGSIGGAWDIFTPSPGEDVIAFHCHQISGRQYVDVGIVVPKEKRKAADKP